MMEINSAAHEKYYLQLSLDVLRSENLAGWKRSQSHGNVISCYMVTAWMHLNYIPVAYRQICPPSASQTYYMVHVA